MNWMTGFHAVEEALAAGRPLDRIVIARGRHGERVEAIVRLAKSRGVPVRFEDRQQLDRLAGTREHQGVAALAAAKPAVELEDLLRAKTRHGLLVLLDGIEDPHNLGAIVRTSLAAGAQGVVIPERRAAGLTDTVERASAGALAHLPVARVKNLVRAMEEMKEAGYWLVGLDERAEKKLHRSGFERFRRNRAGQRRRRPARTDAQALRFSGFDSDHRPGALAQRFRRRRSDALRSRPPARGSGNRNGKLKLANGS